MSKVTIKVPDWKGEEELLEKYSLLKLQEESLREFLESEPDLYSEKDIKGD